MSLKIHGFNTNSETRFYLNCPQCGHSIETNVLRFLIAINVGQPFACDDCGCLWLVDFVGLTRAAELQRAVDHAKQNGASLLATWDNSEDGGMDADDLKKLLRGKHGWLTVKTFANKQAQLFIAPHSERLASN
jgi:predicted RNA-binding Zn-ribbon protein involved in translation (DUF1610 family)